MQVIVGPMPGGMVSMVQIYIRGYRAVLLEVKISRVKGNVLLIFNPT